jgi:hypothetical protein
MNDHVGALGGDRDPQFTGVEDVDDHRMSTHVVDQLSLVAAPRGAGDIVSCFTEKGDQATADDTSGAGYQDLHERGTSRTRTTC